MIGFVEPIMFVGQGICSKYHRIGLTIATTMAQNLIEKLRKANDKVAGAILLTADEKNRFTSRIF